MTQTTTHKCAECGTPIKFFPRLGGGALVPVHFGSGQYLHTAQPVEVQS